MTIREEREKAQWELWSAKTALVTAIVGLVSAILLLPSVATPSQTPSAPTAVIDDPSDGDPVVTPAHTIVRGQVHSLPPGDLVWLTTVKDGDESFQPQDVPCRVGQNDSFSCPELYIGGDDDHGRVFHILVLRVDAPSAEVLKRYNESKPRDRWPGLPALPRGAEVLAERVVVRT